MLLALADWYPLLLLAPFLALELLWRARRYDTVRGWRVRAIAVSLVVFGVHHGRGIHRWNYSDLPLWDMVFGTYRNPAAETPREAGFRPGASARLGAMLAFRDVA